MRTVFAMSRVVGLVEPRSKRSGYEGMAGSQGARFAFVSPYDRAGRCRCQARPFSAALSSAGAARRSRARAAGFFAVTPPPAVAGLAPARVFFLAVAFLRGAAPVVAAASAAPHRPPREGVRRRPTVFPGAGSPNRAQPKTIGRRAARTYTF